MAFFVSHMSAIDFWRMVYATNRMPNSPVLNCNKEFTLTSECSLRHLATVAPSWLDSSFTKPENGMLHLLVHEQMKRSKSQKTIGHTWSKPLPEGAFYQLSDGVFIASPEFAFMQMASTLSFTQLVALGLELCGKYSFDWREKRGFRPRGVPLSTVVRLRGFLQAATGERGVKQALRALEYVDAGAESPMETITWMLLRLPYRRGGYGIANLIMNVDVPLGPEAAIIAKKNSCRIDLHAIETNLAIEYLGKDDHLCEGSFHSDRRRTNALTKEGYEVIELTIDQVRDFPTFEALAMRIARASGKRIEDKYRSLLPQRDALRKDLFTWNAASGRPTA